MKNNYLGKENHGSEVEILVIREIQELRDNFIVLQERLVPRRNVHLGRFLNLFFLNLDASTCYVLEIVCVLIRC